MYEFRKIEIVKPVENVLFKIDDAGGEWIVPQDEANSDYQAYLAYLAEQETTK